MYRCGSPQREAESAVVSAARTARQCAHGHARQPNTCAKACRLRSHCKQRKWVNVGGRRIYKSEKAAIQRRRHGRGATGVSCADSSDASQHHVAAAEIGQLREA